MADTPMSDKIGEVAEVLVRSDGRAVWLSVDGNQIVRIRVERVVVVDQRETTDGEVLEYVGTELRDLRMKTSQWSEMNKRKVDSAKAERRYADSNRYEGRQDIWERVTALLDKIIRDYNLKERQ